MASHLQSKRLHQDQIPTPYITWGQTQYQNHAITPTSRSQQMDQAIPPTSANQPDWLDDDPIFPKRSHRQPGSDLIVEVTRELSEADLPLLADKVQTPQQNLLKVRHCHHQIARLVAQGLELAQISLITGYAPVYISGRLMHSPAFKELVAYYQTQVEQKFIDVAERMKVLGLSSLEELQARMEDEPDQFTRRELMELAELMLVKPQIAKGTNSQSVPGVAINVSFVTPNYQPSSTIDLTRDEEFSNAH